MTSDTIPVRRRLIGAVLRRHRQAAGYTLADAATVLGCDRSKISRIETGQRGIRARELRELLTEYGIDNHQQQTLITIAQHACNGWWDEYRNALPGELLEYAALESLADEILIYEPQMIPHLLHGRAYATAAAEADPALTTPGQCAQAEAAANARQLALVAERPPEVCVILGEAALRHGIGNPGTMRDELLLLARTATTFESAKIQVLPFTAGLHAGIRSAPFSILRFRGAPSLGVVYQSGLTGGSASAGEEDLAAYLRAFQMLKADALSPDDSRRFIEEIAGP